MISEGTKEKWVKRIKYCKERRALMDDYDCDFIRSIDFRFNYNKIELTLRQSFYLNRLFYRLERDNI